MLTEDGRHLYVSYDEYHNLIEKLAIKISMRRAGEKIRSSGRMGLRSIGRATSLVHGPAG